MATISAEDVARFNHMFENVAILQQQVQDLQNRLAVQTNENINLKEMMNLQVREGREKEKQRMTDRRACGLLPKY